MKGIIVLVGIVLLVFSGCIKKIEKNYHLTTAIEINRLNTADFCKYYQCDKVDSYFANMSAEVKKKNALWAMKNMRPGEAYSDMSLDLIKTIQGDYLVIDPTPDIGMSLDALMKIPRDKRIVTIALLDSTDGHLVVKKIVTWDSFFKFIKPKVSLTALGVYERFRAQMLNPKDSRKYPKNRK